MEGLKNLICREWVAGLNCTIIVLHAEIVYLRNRGRDRFQNKLLEIKQIHLFTSITHLETLPFPHVSILSSSSARRNADPSQNLPTLHII
jgi:hypothetical protein